MSATRGAPPSPRSRTVATWMSGSPSSRTSSAGMSSGTRPDARLSVSTVTNPLNRSPRRAIARRDAQGRPVPVRIRRADPAHRPVDSAHARRPNAEMRSADAPVKREKGERAPACAPARIADGRARVTRSCASPPRCPPRPRARARRDAGGRRATAVVRKRRDQVVRHLGVAPAASTSSRTRAAAPPRGPESLELHRYASSTCASREPSTSRIAGR